MGSAAKRAARRRALALLCVLAVAGLGGAETRAADLPLKDQMPVELTLSEQALAEAGQRFMTANQAAFDLRIEVARSKQKVAAALKNLRDHGGSQAARDITKTTELKTQVDTANTLAQIAGRGGDNFFNVTKEMAPYIAAVRDALRAQQSTEQQLAAAEQRLQAANQALGAASKKVRDEKAARETAIREGRAAFILLHNRKIVIPLKGATPDRYQVHVEQRTDVPDVTPDTSSGIRYFSPRFSGFQFGIKYQPRGGGASTGGQESTVPRTDFGYKAQGMLQLEYSFGDWKLTPRIEYAQKPADSGAARSSQAEAARLTARSAKLGELAYPTDRFFNRRSSWGQDFDDQWALKRIGFETVRDRDAVDSLWPASGKPVVVAVLDTGVDRGHPELVGRTRNNVREIFGNKTDDDGNGFVDDTFGWSFITNSFDTWDDNGHGTFVSGIIAARTDNGLGIAGVNPYARILPVKVTDSRHASGSKLIAKGIHYAVDRGARVINISIGGPTLTPEEDEAVRYAVSKDVLVVAAAGNLGVNTANFGPAGTGGVITVAATGHDDARAPFSNFGQAVDIAAPGMDILSLRAINTDMIARAKKDYKPGSAFVGGAQDYYVASGSSFSAPFVSGVASLLMAKFPSLSGAQVKRMILQSARDIDVPGVDQNTGYGLLDARAALAADPSFFIEAGIRGLSVVQGAGGRAVRVSGTANADRFAGARVELGAGDSPASWKKVSDDLTAPVQAGTLADIPVRELAGSKRWTIRVVVRHANGKQREARFVLNLG